MDIFLSFIFNSLFDFWMDWNTSRRLKHLLKDPQVIPRSKMTNFDRNGQKMDPTPSETISLEISILIWVFFYFLWAKIFFWAWSWEKKPRGVFFSWIVLSLATWSRFILMAYWLRVSDECKWLPPVKLSSIYWWNSFYLSTVWTPHRDNGTGITRRTGTRRTVRYWLS